MVEEEETEEEAEGEDVGLREMMAKGRSLVKVWKRGRKTVRQGGYFVKGCQGEEAEEGG